MIARVLSPTEVQVLRLIADGLSDNEIAARQLCSPRTIHTHRDRLFLKTDCHNRVELTRYALANGYVALAWKNTANDG